MIVLEIAATPPGLNRMLRMHWRARQALGKRWRKSIWVARCQAIQGRPEPIHRAKVVIERTSPNLLDTDNLYGSVKVVLDALRCNELIMNDDPQHLVLEVTQKKGPAHLRITIEDARDSDALDPATSVSYTSKPHSVATSSVAAL